MILVNATENGPKELIELASLFRDTIFILLYRNDSIEYMKRMAYTSGCFGSLVTGTEFRFLIPATFKKVCQINSI